MNPKLDTKARLLFRKEEKSKYGEAGVTEWEPGPFVWAELKAVSGGLLVAAQREESRAEYRLTIRFRTDVTPRETRVEINGIIYSISHVAQPVETRQQWLTLLIGRIRREE